MFLVLLMGSTGETGHTLVMAMAGMQDTEQKHVVPLEAEADNRHFCLILLAEASHMAKLRNEELHTPPTIVGI